MLSMKSTYIPINLISKSLHGFKCLSIELKPKIHGGFSFHWYDKSLQTPIFPNFAFGRLFIMTLKRGMTENVYNEQKETILEALKAICLSPFLSIK